MYYVSEYIQTQYQIKPAVRDIKKRELSISCASKTEHDAAVDLVFAVALHPLPQQIGVWSVWCVVCVKESVYGGHWTHLTNRKGGSI